MPITANNTLPNDWNSSRTYALGDLVSYAGIIYRCLQANTNKNPAIETEYWTPLAIYLKDATRMPHGDYSGDESMWERDNIYIDDNGWVYFKKVGFATTGTTGNTLQIQNWANLALSSSEVNKIKDGPWPCFINKDSTPTASYQLTIVEIDAQILGMQIRLI